MKYKKLSDVANFREERTANITFENYISTENMFKDKGGITMAKSLPNVKQLLLIIQMIFCFLILDLISKKFGMQTDPAAVQTMF